MTGAHTIFAEYLTTILQDITLNQRTGLLRIEYVGEHTVEKGAIFFKRGNTVFACTEREIGEKALLHIVSWDKVYYSFLEGVQLATRQRGASAHYTPVSSLLASVQRKEACHTPPAGTLVISQDARLSTAAIPIHTAPIVPSSPAKKAPHVVFRVLPQAATPKVMNQIERQDRVVFMLLDGKRTIQDVAHLVHRSELDVAHTLIRLLKRGYIEYVAEEEDDHSEQNVARKLAQLFTGQ